MLGALACVIVLVVCGFFGGACLIPVFVDAERTGAIRNMKFIMEELIQRGYSAEKILEIMHIYIDVQIE